ncbi:hypothetical protein ACLIA0_00240 [Bacillaceae bacterium W0354]
MKKIKLLLLLVILTVLSACLYPDERLKQNMPTNDEQLERVQAAVHEYRDRQNGLLPILTRDSDVDLFVKYPVDFNKLKELNILGETPKNAYEQGGYYTYVIVDPEDEALVKVVDVRLTQKLRSINYEITLYRNKNIYPPFANKIFDDYFEIDKNKINNKDDLTVTSPYSGTELDVIINLDGEALVDYRPDVYQLIQEHQIESYDRDLRYLLTEYYPFTPAYSPPMILEDGKVIFTDEN